jgi:polar amino acid transport system ATP-binding protein
MLPLVELRDVYKRYGTSSVLNGVTFCVEKGKVVAIIGKSGSGKSTVLRCINRLEKIDSGNIVVCGHDVHSKNLDRKAMRSNIGIVFQSYNLFPHLNVEENITLALRWVKKLDRKSAKEIAHKALEQVGLIDKLLSFPEQLSGGQQQRVAIARALAMTPQVLLFDEVTSALDPELTGEVLRVMENLATEGTTMLIVTHEMAFARKIADVVIFMHLGRVWEIGSAEILDSPKTPELRQFVGSSI